MLLLVLGLFFLCFYQIQYNRNEVYSIDEWLDRDSTQCLRGAAAIFILLAHIPGMATYLNSDYSKTWEQYFFAGYMVVGIFFMLSGYGLSVPENISLKGFLPKRLGKLIVPYILANIIYFIPEKFENPMLSLKDVFLSFFNGSPFVLYSWYIIAQLIFYIFFYIAFSVSKKRSVSIIVLIGLQFIYTVILYFAGWDSPWWHGCLCFSLGVIIGSYKKQIYNFLNRRKLKVLVFISLGLTILLYWLYWLFLTDINFYDYSAVTFVVLVALLSLKFKLNNKALSFLGKISLEIYLYHGIILKILKSLMLKLGISNIFIYGVIALIVTVFGGYIINFVDTFAIKKYLKLIK